MLIVLGIEVWAVTVSVTEFALVGDPGGWIADAFVIFDGESQAVDVGIEVSVRNQDIGTPTALQVCSRSDAYFALSNQSQVPAYGLNGVFEISVDYRLPIVGEDPRP